MKNLNTLLNDAKAILDSLDIPYGNVIIYENKRFKRKWGNCRWDSSTQKYIIQISSRLLQDNVPYEAAMDTIIHELLHAYTGRMCHTGDWKICANMVNKAYPQYNIKRCTSAEEKGLDVENYIQETTKYIITCKKCGVKNYYRKKSKVVRYIMDYPHTHGCKCSVCGGRFFTVEDLTIK